MIEFEEGAQPLPLGASEVQDFIPRITITDDGTDRNDDEIDQPIADIWPTADRLVLEDNAKDHWLQGHPL